MNRVKWTLVFLLLSLGAMAQSSLDEYIRTAAEQNPGLQARFKAYLAALEKVDHQGALPDPTLSFGYFISPVETRVGAQRFKLSVSQMFPWMGTLDAKRQKATSQARVRFEEFEEARNLLVLNVKSKWLALYELEKEIQINEANLDILKTYEPITKTKYEANLVSLSDLVRVQIKIDEAQTNLDLLKLKRIPLTGDFNTLLNRELTSPVEVLDTLVAEKADHFSLDSVLAHQPKILAAKEQLLVLDAEQTLAELKRKPNLGFGLDYAFVSERNVANLEDNGKDILMPMVSLSLPIFGKKNKALKREVSLLKESAEARLESVEKTLTNDWNRVNYLVQSAETEIALYQSEIEKTSLLLRVLTGEYSNNNLNFEEVLNTQQRLLQLRLAEMKARVKYCEAVFQKEYLTGQALKATEQ